LFEALVQLFDFCFLPLKNNQPKKQKAMCCMAWATKTMTEKQPCGEALFYPFLCGGWVGHLLQHKRKRFIFYRFFLLQWMIIFNGFL
jgi:hypothetical protein